MVNEENIAKVRQLVMLANELGLKLSQLALAWCLRNQNVNTAIIAATKNEQVTENVIAADMVYQIEGEVLERIESVLDNRPI